jgi:predicted transglutaminase-like cysteine proteinase
MRGQAMMKFTAIQGIMTFSLSAFLFAAPASSAPLAPASMSVGDYTSQPIGHYEFCKKYVKDCNEFSSDLSAAKLTDRGWKILNAVNSDVNTKIIPMTDMEIYNKEEVWAYPVKFGDCEDFVLEKRKELIAKGVPTSDVLITVVRKQDGEGHAVLTVRTSQGDYILDNLTNEIKLWTDTPYSYVKRQDEGDSGRWVAIEPRPDVLVGSAQ